METQNPGTPGAVVSPTFVQIDLTEATVPVIRGDGTIVSDLPEESDWRNLKSSTPEIDRRWLKRTDAGDQLAMQSLLKEQHHHSYGRPWLIGRLFVDQLFHSGLDPRSRVLDLGCGAGRVGVWLIPFLEADRYFGVDNHLPSLVAFAAYETVLHGLTAKRPRLMLSDRFEVDGFGEQFDVFLDFNLTRHLDDAQTETAIRQVRMTAAPGARLFMNAPPRLGLAQLRAWGLDLVERREVGYRLPDLGQAQVRFEVHWHQFAVT